MRLIKCRKLCTCKSCNKEINKGDYKYPQRRGKSICFDCGYKVPVFGFIGWILKRLK